MTSPDWLSLIWRMVSVNSRLSNIPVLSAKKQKISLAMNWCKS
jgi:hypothetical protein